MAVADTITTARSELLRGLVGDLPSDDLGALHGLLARMMTAVVRRKHGGAWICRLCDLDACGRGTGRCPAANAAAAIHGVDRQTDPAR